MSAQVRFAVAKSLFDYLASIGFSRAAQEHGWGAVYEWVREQCRTCQGRRLTVLDVGCADGEIGSTLAQEGVLDYAVGIDFSQAMLDSCRSRGQYNELFLGDLNFGLPDTGGARFDVAIVCGVLEFVEDAPRVLRDLRSVLKPGGELWVTFEVPIDGTCPELPPSSWKFGRSRDEAVALVQGSGYVILSVDQRVAYQAVTGAPGGGFRSLGIDVGFTFIRAALS